MLCLFFNLSGLSGASIVVQDSDAQNACASAILSDRRTKVFLDKPYSEG